MHFWVIWWMDEILKKKKSCLLEISVFQWLNKLNISCGLIALLVLYLTALSVWRRRRTQMCSSAAVRATCATRSSSTTPISRQFRVRLPSATQTAKSLRVLEVLQLYLFLWCNCAGVDSVGVKLSFLSLSHHSLYSLITSSLKSSDYLKASKAFFMTIHVKSHNRLAVFFVSFYNPF